MVEDFSEEKELKWYYKSWAIAIAVLLFGPLGLLPLWFRPRTKVYVKILISVGVLAATAWTFKEALEVYRKMLDHYRKLGEIMESM